MAKSLDKLKLKSNYSLRQLTTFKLGGPAKFFIRAKTLEDLIKAIKWAERDNIRWLVIGEGSNLVPNDDGFAGLIIKNEIRELVVKDKRVLVGAGNNLLQLVRQLNKLGLGGMEKMAGIPGTVGGAIRGAAGAYGQEIKDNILRVKIYDGQKIYWLKKSQCGFTYRGSVFKTKEKWVIVAAEFSFKRASPKELAQISKDIIKQREKKYPKGLNCPGSFFKNIVLENIKSVAARKKLISKIEPEKINHGKVAAGYFLELVGAKGMKSGGIVVADYHGNLLYNLGNGQTTEVKKLAQILKAKVKKKFDLDLVEEVQYL